MGFGGLNSECPELRISGVLQKHTEHIPAEDVAKTEELYTISDNEEDRIENFFLFGRCQQLRTSQSLYVRLVPSPHGLAKTKMRVMTQKRTSKRSTTFRRVIGYFCAIRRLPTTWAHLSVRSPPR